MSVCVCEGGGGEGERGDGKAGEEFKEKKTRDAVLIFYEREGWG